MRGWFSVPVAVMLKPGKVDIVTTTAKAAELLVSPLWTVHGPAHRAACEAVHDALAGTGTDLEARAAFEAAAIEAGVLRKPR